MSSSKPLLEPLRVRLRRLQFTVGLGFLALMLGSVLTGALNPRLVGGAEAVPSVLLRFVIDPVLKSVWVLAALPLLCYGAARLLELRPWTTALGAAFSGQVFILALDFVSNGVDGWVERGGLLTAVEWAVFAGGVVLSQRAVVGGRAHAHRQAEQARQQAATKKDEYAEFLREAERAGEKEVAEQQPQDEPKAPAA